MWASVDVVQSTFLVTAVLTKHGIKSPIEGLPFILALRTAHDSVNFILLRGYRNGLWKPLLRVIILVMRVWIYSSGTAMVS